MTQQKRLGKPTVDIRIFRKVKKLFLSISLQWRVLIIVFYIPGYLLLFYLSDFVTVLKLTLLLLFILSTINSFFWRKYMKNKRYVRLWVNLSLFICSTAVLVYMSNWKTVFIAVFALFLNVLVTILFPKLFTIRY